VSTRHCGLSWPIVPTPGDREDGEVLAEEAGVLGKKPAPTQLCSPQIPLTRPGYEPGLPRWKASD
jgi:hypothetical protein